MEAYFKIKKNNGEQEKESIIPQDHRLSSQGKPRDANP